MKRVAFLFIAIVAFTGVASAQNLGDMLKGAVTEFIDEKTEGKVTEYLLAATWDYTEPGMRFESENQLASLAGEAVEDNVSKRLSSAYNVVGIKPGNHSLTLNNDDTFTMVIGKRTLTGNYTYNADTHAIVFNFDTKLIKLTSLSGYAYIDGDNLEVVYDCSKLKTFLAALSKVSVLDGVISFLNNYDNVLLGFSYSRK